MSASKNSMVRPFSRHRRCRVLSVFSGWQILLILGFIVLFPGAAWGENIEYTSQDPTKLAKPSDVFGGWPQGTGYADPSASLFPWLSGSDNIVTVRTHIDNSTTSGYVLGGLWQTGTYRNKVYILDAADVGKVYGGGALGSASFNEVYLRDNARATQVTGALSAGRDPGTPQPSGSWVSYNKVFITDNARVDGIVSGGWNASGTSPDPDGDTGGVSISDASVFRNSVWIGRNADINDNIYGGYNEGNSHTYGNSIVIAGGSVTAGQIVGGYSSVYGSTGTTAVYGNTVTIFGGTINLGSGTYSGVYGGRSQASASGQGVEVFYNAVNVTGGIIPTGTVSGGSAGANSGTTSYVHHNAVNISGGTIANAAGGRANDAGRAEYNEVRLSGGMVTGNIYGAYDASTGTNMATIRNNRVILSGGTAANVYAGYSFSANNTLVQNNAVLLYGGGTVKDFLYGTNMDTWAVDGNRLEVLGGLTDAGGVGTFQTVAISAGAALNVTGTTAPSYQTVSAASAAVFYDLANDGRLSFYNGAANQYITHITGAYSGGGAIGLDVLVSPDATTDTGDSVIFERTPATPVLLEVKRLPGSRAAPYTPVTRIATFSDGGTPVLRTTEHGYGIYAYDIRQVSASGGGYDYLLGLTDAYTGDIGGSYSDGSGANLVQVGTISESFLRDNLENAVLSSDGGGFGIAANMSYSRQRFNTGNHVDVEGLAAYVTLSYHAKGTPFAVGVFADTFQGWYSTRNSVSLPMGDYGIKARGDLESYGGGVSFQYREKLDEAIASGAFAAWTPGPYLKALARAGYSRMEFETDDAVHPSSFAVGGLYYGASLGGGFVFEPDPRFVVDLYGYGAWTSLAERDVTDSLGQRIDFARADSLRLISGFRAAYKATENILPYAGLAAEWETLGRPEARIDGYKADTADFSGVSGLIELGVNSRVAESVFLDVKAAGSVGQREGIGGMLEIRYTF